MGRGRIKFAISLVSSTPPKQPSTTSCNGGNLAQDSPNVNKNRHPQKKQGKHETLFGLQSSKVVCNKESAKYRPFPSPLSSQECDHKLSLSLVVVSSFFPPFFPRLDLKERKRGRGEERKKHFKSVPPFLLTYGGEKMGKWRVALFSCRLTREKRSFFAQVIHPLPPPVHFFGKES